MADQRDIPNLLSRLNDSLATPEVSETIVVLEGATSATAETSETGHTSQIIFIVPELNGSGATAELKLLDSDGYEIYTSGEKAESSTHIINVDRRLHGTTTIKIETSIETAGDESFIVKIR